jgi:hypothetical protein
MNLKLFALAFLLVLAMASADLVAIESQNLSTAGGAIRIDTTPHTAAQSFTTDAGETNVSYMVLPLWMPTPATYTVNFSIVTGATGPSTTLASANCTSSFSTAGLNAVKTNTTIAFTNPCVLVPGTYYWIYGTGGGANAVWWGYETVGPYRGSTYFMREDANNYTTNDAGFQLWANFTPPSYPGYGLISNTYSSPVVETSDTSFWFSLWYNTTNITAATASLVWNGTKYSPTSTSNSTAGDNLTITWNYSGFSVPLTNVNNTGITTYWEYNLTWANTTITTLSGTSSNQSILQGFSWGTYTPSSAVIEGSTVYFSANITEEAGTNHSAFSSVLALFNNTNYSLAYAAGLWSGNTTAPIVGTNTNFTSNSTFLLAWTGEDGVARTRLALSANATVLVAVPSFGACTAGTFPAVNFTFYNETLPTAAVLSDMDLSFSWWANADHSGIQYNGTANATNTYNVTLCLYPNVTLYVDSFQVYHDTAGVQRIRNYFLTNATITNTTRTVDLYNIPTAESDLLTITVTDTLVSQPDVFVLMERYYPAENLFRTVEIGMTDADGKTFLYPVPNDVYYRFLVVRDYSTDYSGDPREIGIASFTIDIGGSASLEYFDYQGISVSCNRTGDIIGCSLVNPTGLDVGAALLVRELGIYHDTEICSTNVTSVTSTTLLCNVSGHTGVIQADLMFIAPESLLAAWTQTFNGSGTNVFGGLGLLVGVLVIIGSTLLLAYSPALALVGAVLGLAISAITGIVALSLTSVILIVVAAGFILVKVRS